MKSDRNRKRFLFVEGSSDKNITSEILDIYLPHWQIVSRRKKSKNPIKDPRIDIIDARGINNITSERLATAASDSNLHSLGIVIDADTNAQSRWDGICQTCKAVDELDHIPFPKQIPNQGFVEKIDNDKKFGIWVIPDNHSPGMTETLLSQLIPNDREDLWIHVQTSVSQAKQLGATFDDKHLDKAHIYTWLAWHHKPGAWLKTGERAVFNFDHPQVHAFVDWLKTLYDL
ncbi:DUF3226 domain-containing protein [Limnothrix redekei]|uniref:DUF3226 domain-containing protein n=1 Tax=Limnothrix redekei LRLZ20PSL1 TaxID=3112953 RepID=A0ABW7CA94_9CYAN